MARQGRFDAQAEDAKAIWPPEHFVESVFEVLDRGGKGYVTERDLFLLAQDFDGAATYGSLCALVREAPLRRGYDPKAQPCRLSFRDVAYFVLPAHSHEMEVVCAADSDEEARSVLYLLRNSEPCPRCGIRVQRDADAAGCPSVTCPLCGAVFRCFVVVSDHRRRHGIGGGISGHWWGGGSGGAGLDSTTGPVMPLPLPRGSRYQLYRLIAALARIAEDLDLDRRGLATQSAGCDAAALSDAFGLLAGGQSSFVLADVRWAFGELGIYLSEREFRCLWRRYAPLGGLSCLGRGSDLAGGDPRRVAFPEFVRQLRPLATVDALVGSRGF